MITTSSLRHRSFRFGALPPGRAEAHFSDRSAQGLGPKTDYTSGLGGAIFEARFTCSDHISDLDFSKKKRKKLSV